jgi:hypothetical protein
MKQEIKARMVRRTHGGPNVLIIAPQYIAAFTSNATGTYRKPDFAGTM